MVVMTSTWLSLESRLMVARASRNSAATTNTTMVAPRSVESVGRWNTSSGVRVGARSQRLLAKRRNAFASAPIGGVTPASMAASAVSTEMACMHWFSCRARCDGSGRPRRGCTRARRSAPRSARRSNRIAPARPVRTSRARAATRCAGRGLPRHRVRPLFRSPARYIRPRREQPASQLHKAIRRATSGAAAGAARAGRRSAACDRGSSS